MEATGRIISIKPKIGRSGHYWGVSVKVAEQDFVWFSRGPKAQAESPLKVGATVTVSTSEPITRKGSFTFLKKVSIVEYDAGTAPPCPHSRVIRDDGAYSCEACGEAAIVSFVAEVGEELEGAVA